MCAFGCRTRVNEANMSINESGDPKRKYRSVLIIDRCLEAIDNCRDAQGLRQFSVEVAKIAAKNVDPICPTNRELLSRAEGWSFLSTKEKAELAAEANARLDELREAELNNNDAATELSWNVDYAILYSCLDDKKLPWNAGQVCNYACAAIDDDDAFAGLVLPILATIEPTN